MSGGGRCNFTNLHTTPANFLSGNVHFCKSALARYGPRDFIALVEKHRIRYHEKELGQLFCDESASDIVEMLRAECAQAEVRIALKCTVGEIAKLAAGFALDTSTGPVTAAALVFATGGLSIPTLGATGFGYQISRQFGHDLRPTRAALVPFTLGGTERERCAALSGVSLPVCVRGHGAEFTGAMLFTHRGISGPALLQIASYWTPGEVLEVDLLPGIDARDWLQARRRERPDASLGTVLASVLPKRFAQDLCAHELSNRPLKQHSPPELVAIAELLAHWPLRPAGTEGYRTAEVTLGGVDTNGLSSATMASKIVPDLYFIGEVVDVSGQLGGFNFQWAWASGHAAGLAV
jgi:predicted Rossmann fold flavoprotein